MDGGEESAMALAELVWPHLPYLRRFSRALSGSQKSGDAYVEALLETLISSPGELDADDGKVRLRLYALLCRLWESISLNLQISTPDDHWERAAQLKLANIRPRPRQAFLLTAVEGFSFEEAAEILGTGGTGFADL